MPENSNKDNSVSLSYPENARLIYVSYGLKNVTQSYAGGTIIVDTVENKPSFVPIYIDDGVYVCCVYIYVATKSKVIQTYQIGGDTSHTLLLRCYYF